jgi:menaquinone-9 beta-reductase
VDALIIGAGPAGSTAALLLARAGWSVAIVERAGFPRRKVCGEYLSFTNLALFGELGLLDDFRKLAGPPVRRVGVFSGYEAITARMPAGDGERLQWGRALRREVLDTMLLQQAKEAGVAVWQPWSAIGLKRLPIGFDCELASRTGDQTTNIAARVVIAAHGSWEQGTLPTQADRKPARPADLLGFKAHFENSGLDSDLMPVVVFPGGYGGMVTCDDGHVSLSCCVRRDALERAREQKPQRRAGEVLQEHIINNCPGVRRALQNAKLKDEWLSAGPIRPGIRRRFRDGIFLIGNAAGESHPIIAEGISMAMQSAWLLVRSLTSRSIDQVDNRSLLAVAAEYDRDWLRAFRLRIRAAEVYARLALARRAHKLLYPIVRFCPSVLTLGARASGKVNQILDRRVADIKGSEELS